MYQKSSRQKNRGTRPFSSTKHLSRRHEFCHPRLSCLTLAIVGAIASFSVHAQESASTSATAQESKYLDEVVVTASRSENSIASIPGSVQVIKAQEIDQQTGAGSKVADLLGSLIPGLTPSSGTMTNYGQTLRGRNALILIDGVPQNASRDTFRQLNSISPESIERVEVISGASSLYGAGATGGIINLITKRNQGQKLAFQSRVGLTAGRKLNTEGFAYELFQSATGKSDQFDWYLSANWIKRGAQYDAKGERIPQDTSQGSEMDTSTHDLVARLGYQISKERRLTLGLQRFVNEQDTDYGYQDIAGEAKAVKGLHLDEQPRTVNHAVNLNYNDKSIQGHELQLESYWRKQEARFYPDRPRRRAGLTATTSDVEVMGLRAAVNTALPVMDGIDTILTWGLDLEHEDLRQDGKQYTREGLRYTPTGRVLELGPDIQTDTMALFIQSSWYMGPWTLRGGLRQQWMRSDIKDSISYGDIQLTGTGNVLPGAKLKYNATLFNIGAVRSLNDEQEVFLNFSQGFTLPDLQRFLRDALSTFDVRTLNSQALKVNSIELGWRGNWEQLQANATLFHNTSSVTQYYDAKDRVLRLKNQKERVRGFETGLTYALGGAWRIGGSYAYTQGETQEEGRWIDLPATRIAPQKLTAFIDYRQGDYDIRLQTVNLRDYTAAERDQNGRAIQGYTLVDLLGSVKLPKGRLDVGIYNLTNRDYHSVFMQANANAPWPKAQGRTVSLKYAIDW